MIYLVNIQTDSINIVSRKSIQARSSMEALLLALHHETSAYQHLKDMPHARLHIQVEPVSAGAAPLTLNQEIGGKQ